MADGSPTLYGKGRSAPDEVWGRVREDYLSGLPGIEVCRRHGVGLTAMRNRAAREGWRRTDQPWTPPNTLDPDDEGVLLEHEIDGDLDRVELRQHAPSVSSLRYEPPPPMGEDWAVLGNPPPSGEGDRVFAVEGAGCGWGVWRLVPGLAPSVSPLRFEPPPPMGEEWPPPSLSLRFRATSPDGGGFGRLG